MMKKIAFLGGSILLLVIAYSLLGQTFSAFKSGDRLSQELDKLKNLQVKNEELKQQLVQVQSLEFVEQQARNKLGLAKPGETVVVIPPDRLKQVLGVTIEKPIEIKLPNWEGWLKLFFK